MREAYASTCMCCTTTQVEVPRLTICPSLTRMHTTSHLHLHDSTSVAGGWLLLKNLHLVVSWLPALEREIHAVIDGSAGGSGAGGAAGAAACHPGFRLFLASQPHAKFPQTLLERSVKVCVFVCSGVGPGGLRSLCACLVITQ